MCRGAMEWMMRRHEDRGAWVLVVLAQCMHSYGCVVRERKARGRGAAQPRTARRGLICGARREPRGMLSAQTRESAVATVHRRERLREGT